MLPSLHMLPLGSPAPHEETSEEIERLLCDRDRQALPSLAALNLTPISATKRDRDGLAKIAKMTTAQFKNAYIDWRKIDRFEKTVANTLEPHIFDQWAACCLFARGFDFWIKRSYGVMDQQPVKWDYSSFTSNAHRLIAALLLLKDPEADELVGLSLREFPEWESSWSVQLANDKIRRLLIELFLCVYSRTSVNIRRDLNDEAKLHDMPYFKSREPALEPRIEAAKQVFDKNMVDLMDKVGAHARTLLDAAFETLGVNVRGRLTVYRGDQRTPSNYQSYYSTPEDNKKIPRPNLDQWLGDYSKSVVSTTMSIESEFYEYSNDACCKFKIDVREGVRVLYLTDKSAFALVPEQYGGFVDEREVLLPKGLLYESNGSNVSGKVSNRRYYVTAYTASTTGEGGEGGGEGDEGGGELGDGAV